MSFFDFFKGRNYPKSTGSIADDMQKISEDMNKVVKFPEIKPPLELAQSQPRECYRIGYDDVNDMVSITVMAEKGGGSITMRMNYPAAQQMIRMINTAFPEDIER